MAEATVIGAGLAGAEAAWQLVCRGIPVQLYEMRPVRQTPVHQTGYFGELVCSNSLRAAALENAVGLLKEEMRLLNSLIIACADAAQVPAGAALAVDREVFARSITERLSTHPLVTVHRGEISQIPAEGVVILATGPLTSPNLAASISTFTGEEYLYFYDAVAPIVTFESLNQDVVFRSNRYDKGEPAYWNCPLNEAEYAVFWEALVAAEKAPRQEFEKDQYFEGCMPVEVLAARGKDTLLYGPMKPVGLTDPRTGQRPYGVVQLRQDNAAATLFNLVGFQTSLQWPEQSRVLRLIPGLEAAEIVRYGVMHKNTFINAPVLLQPTLQCKKRANLFFAGQITGVEGYVESAASGLMAGVNAAALLQGREPEAFPANTAHGALAAYITNAAPGNFQPMNINFGLFPPMEKRIRNKRERNQTIANTALAAIREWTRTDPLTTPNAHGAAHLGVWGES